MKKLIVPLAALAATLFVSAVSARNYIVQELNQGKDGMFVFQPGYLHIRPGDSVTFEPTDQGHDSVAVLVPPGAKKWRSEIGQKYTVKFAKQGVYIYECSPHHLLGMFGVIQVGKAVNKVAAGQQGKKLQVGVSMNQDRLGKYLREVR